MSKLAAAPRAESNRPRIQDSSVSPPRLHSTVDEAETSTTPKGPWAWRQTWSRLLFAHWRIDAAVLRPLLPASLEIDQFDGSAWIGVVPFQMSGVARRPLPPLPGTDAFCELNVRTYVRSDGRSGVWFFSLDAAHRLAVRAARAWFSLPYHYARMRSATCGRQVLYSSQRASGEAEFVARYGPIGPAVPAEPGTLEHFLTERYSLFSQHRGRLHRGDVRHAPWPLQRAEATIERNSMLAPLGLPTSDEPPHLLYADRVDVQVWNLAPV